MREGFRSTFLFLVRSGDLVLTQSPVAGRLQRRKEQANAKKAERNSVRASMMMVASSSSSPNNHAAASSSPLSSGAELEDMRTREAAEVIWERMRQHMKESGTQKIHDLFREIDTDNSGYIDKDEFKAALDNMGIEGVSAKVIRRVMRTADPNGDGQLDFREVRSKNNHPPKLFIKHHALRVFIHLYFDFSSFFRCPYAASRCAQAKRCT
jgi:Ca2+-binding EF-hand superfamily protein